MSKTGLSTPNSLIFVQFFLVFAFMASHVAFVFSLLYSSSLHPIFVCCLRRAVNHD